MDEITDTGALNEELADMIRNLRQQLPNAEVLAAEVREVQTRQRALRVDRILWESALRGNQLSDKTIRRQRATDYVLSQSALDSLVQLIKVANRVSDRMSTLSTALLEAQSRTIEVASMLDGRVLWLRTNASVGFDWIYNTVTGVQWIGHSESWSGLSAALTNGMRDKTLLLLFLVLGSLLSLTTRPRLRDLIKRSTIAFL